MTRKERLDMLWHCCQGYQLLGNLQGRCMKHMREGGDVRLNFNEKEAMKKYWKGISYGEKRREVFKYYGVIK